MTHDSIVPRVRARRMPRGGWLDGLARRAVHAALHRIRRGRLTLHDFRGTHRFAGGADGPSATLSLHTPAAYRSVALGGSVGAGEAYMRGDWSTPDLTAALRFFLANSESLAALDRGLSRLSAPLRRLFHLRRANTLAGSRRNIAAHYDLGNDFYRLILDPSMTYSAGIFERPDSTLHDASIAKLDRICRKLDLRPDDHVIEIGTGWGSFALHAAGRYGCRVTTTTISQQQYEYATQRVRDAGLSAQVTVLGHDYRRLRGQFDKLVSIEMIEAIGWRQYPTFFTQCARLLKPSGQACIQSITMADRYYERARHEVDFIKRYIFPGSCIPSIAALSAAIARSSDLTITHLEELGPHYARTLRCWHENTRRQAEAIRALSMPPEFLRMWEFYLCYCEAGFLERTIGVAQIVLNKPECSALWNPCLPTRES